MENGRPAAYVRGGWRSVSPPNAQTSYNSGFVLPYSIERRVAIVLVAADDADTLADSTLRDFEEKGLDKLAFYMLSASTGAEVVGRDEL